MIAPIAPPALVQAADPFELHRCTCPRCRYLDARHPGEGYQLALFPYRMARRPRAERLNR